MGHVKGVSDVQYTGLYIRVGPKNEGTSKP